MSNLQKFEVRGTRTTSSPDRPEESNDLSSALGAAGHAFFADKIIAKFTSPPTVTRTVDFETKLIVVKYYAAGFYDKVVPIGTATEVTVL